jgi:hypothetical protein
VQASQLNFFQYTIMNSFMLLTPHMTKNILGANNTKQQTTNHQHNGSDGLDAMGSPAVVWCKGPTMPHLQAVVEAQIVHSRMSMKVFWKKLKSLKKPRGKDHVF